MSLYSSYIFPRLCDFVLNKPHVAIHRLNLLSRARGKVLEIGFGTGINLPCYPPTIQQLTVIEPNPGMNRRAEKRINQNRITIDWHRGTAEHLPFADETFDSVVSTFTLCSVRQVNQALSEIYRVLKPEGQFLFLEHGLSNETCIQRWQHRMNWLQNVLADGCHLDRNIKELVAAQPFSSVEVHSTYLEKTPKIFGYLYTGHATK